MSRCLAGHDLLHGSSCGVVRGLNLQYCGGGMVVVVVCGD